MGVLQDLASHILSVEQLNAEGVPTASLAILENGKISSHVITNGKENDQTVYQACSISKAITAIGVAKLVDAGKLSHDTKVREHLEQSTIDCLVDEKTSFLLSHVTVGMLLSHTAGLSQHGFPGYVDKPPTAEDVLAGRHPSNTPQVYFLHFPGQQFQYSGGGFTVLQIVIENLTKVPFPEFMRTTVLEPLCMTRSRYGTLSPEEDNYTDAYWTAYTKAGRHNFIEHAAASLWTTPTDLLKAISAVQESLYTDHGFISQATAKKMLSQVAPIPPLQVGIGLGWGVTESFFAHAGGNDPGYRCYAVGFKDGETKPGNGLAIMTNGQLGQDVCNRVVSAIFYLKGWKRAKQLPMLDSSDDEFAPWAAPQDVKVDEGWRDWIGKWEDDWEVVNDGGPAVMFRSFKPMRLKVAAAPVSEMEEGKKEFIFAVDGLDLGLRLTWEDGERVVRMIGEGSKSKRLRWSGETST